VWKSQKKTARPFKGGARRLSACVALRGDHLLWHKACQGGSAKCGSRGHGTRRTPRYTPARRVISACGTAGKVLGRQAASGGTGILGHIPIIPVSWDLAAKTAQISLGPVSVANSMCRGQEKRTMRETQTYFGNSGQSVGIMNSVVRRSRQFHINRGGGTCKIEVQWSLSRWRHCWP
jgi:hypothetical protein